MKATALINKGEADKVLRFVEHMATTALKACKDPASLCSIVYRGPFFHTRFPEIHCSGRISLTICLHQRFPKWVRRNPRVPQTNLKASASYTSS